MSFDLDKQTQKDLEIFNEDKDGNSIFSFFNQTKSLGGRNQLKEIMLNPFSSLKQIEEHRDSIKFFIDNKIDFEINGNQLDFIAYYLTLNTPILKHNLIDVFYQRISYLIQPNKNFYLIKTGIEKIIILLSNVKVELKDLNIELAPDKLKEKFKLIKLILGKESVNAIINNKKKLSFYSILKFDSLFRKEMKEQFNFLIAIIYTFDALQSISKVKSEKSLAFSTYSSSIKPSIIIDSLYHPFIDDPIKNDVFINQNQNLVFLTGPNMAGKSTFLKSVGLCVYLSHLGFPVPASKMETTIYKGLITTINLPDNMSKGYSHFYSEVMRVKQTALLIKEKLNVFVIFDELFRGTNVKDASDASLEVISCLSRIATSTFYISTHITEIAKELKANSNIDFKYFESSLIDEKPVYSYKIKDGLSEERMGMYILKNEKISEILNSIA